MAKTGVEDLVDSFDDGMDKIAELEALAGASSSLEEFLRLAEPQVAQAESAKVEAPAKGAETEDEKPKVVIVDETPKTCFYCDCEPIATLQMTAVCEFHLLNDGECSKCHKGASSPAPASVEDASTLQTPSATLDVDGSTTSNSAVTDAVEERASVGVMAMSQAEYSEEFKQIYNTEILLLQKEDSLVYAEERKDELERFIREAKIKINAIQNFQDGRAKKARKDELEAWDKRGKELAARKPRVAKGDGVAKKTKAQKSDEEIIREQLTKLNLPAAYIEQMVAEHKAAKGLK